MSLCFLTVRRKLPHAGFGSQHPVLVPSPEPSSVSNYIYNEYKFQFLFEDRDLFIMDVPQMLEDVQCCGQNC